MKIKLLVALLASSLWCGWAQAQDFNSSYNFVAKGTQGPGRSFANTTTTAFAISWNTTSTVSSCALQVDSSADGITWGNADLIASQNCAVVGSVAATALATGKNFVRINVTALVGNGGLNVTLTGVAGVSSSASSPGNFSFASTAGAADDDSTDNCASGAVAAFNTAVNAYSGPGTPSVVIGPKSAASKAYKLSTSALACHFEFDQPVNLTVSANLDCAQASTAENCIQFGAKALGAQAFVAKSNVTGGGTMFGGAGLVNGGIEIEPFVTNTVINGIQFLNFGAGNATLGSCTNFAIVFDGPNVFEGTVQNVQWTINDSTAGRCFGSNANGASQGTNTVYWFDNVLGGANGPGFPPTTCSSVAIVEGGAYGEVSRNNIYGFAVLVRVQGLDTTLDHNTIDGAACVNHGVTAAFQWGAIGAATSVVNTTVSHNKLQINHTQTLWAKAGDAGAATQTGTIVIANSSNGGAGILYDTTACGVNTSAASVCYAAFNSGFTATPSGVGVQGAGWMIADGNIGVLPGGSAQAANFGPTNIINAPLTSTYVVYCGVILTRAATTSSTLPGCTVSWTDAFTGVAQSVAITPAWTAGGAGCSPSTGGVTNTLGNACYGYVFIGATTGTALNISTTAYASSGATTMQYTVFARAVITN